MERSPNPEEEVVEIDVSGIAKETEFIDEILGSDAIRLLWDDGSDRSQFVDFGRESTVHLIQDNGSPYLVVKYYLEGSEQLHEHEISLGDDLTLSVDYDVDSEITNEFRTELIDILNS